MAYTAAEKGEDPGNEVAKLRSPRSPDNSPDWSQVKSEFASH